MGRTGLWSKYGNALEMGHLIGGEEVFEGEWAERKNPSDREDLVARFPVGSKETLRKALRAAREWSKTPAPVRGQVLFNQDSRAREAHLDPAHGAGGGKDL